MNKDVRFVVKVVGCMAFGFATLGMSFPGISFALLGFTCWYALSQW